MLRRLRCWAGGGLRLRASVAGGLADYHLPQVGISARLQTRAAAVAQARRAQFKESPLNACRQRCLPLIGARYQVRHTTALLDDYRYSFGGDLKLKSGVINWVQLLSVPRSHFLLHLVFLMDYIV